MYTIDTFQGFTDKSPKPDSLARLVELIRSDHALQVSTHGYRMAKAAGDKRHAQLLKSGVLCFAVAVRFSGGKSDEAISSYTGLTLVDLDGIDPTLMPTVLSAVKADVHTLLAYTTLSGCGVRVLTRYALNDDDDQPSGRQSTLTLSSTFPSYKLAFNTVNEYYRRLTGVGPDLKCSNPTRLSALAHDPDVLYRPDALPIDIATLAAQYEAERQATKRPIGRPPKGKGEEEKGKSGRPIAPKLIDQVLAKVEAQGIRYEPHSHNDYIARACYEMNRLGVSEADCTEWAVTRFADYAATDDVPAIVRSCYRKTHEHATRQPRRTAKGESRYASVEDIEEFLTHHAALRYNTVSRIVEIRYLHDTTWKPLEDKDLNSLWRTMAKQCGMRVIKDDMYSIMRSDYPTTYNPFEEYIRSLPAWDGQTDYIARLASSVTVESDAHEWGEVFRKWFVGFIAAIFSSEEVNHEILVFIGEQGKYKSTWFYYLLPPELRRYFLIKLMDGAITKDDLFNIAQSALVCLEEIDNMKQKELNQLKALTTMRTINVRRPYGRFNEVLPHIASFCATGNNRYYLTDRTANRRFLTFEVTHIETPQEYDYQYAGLYAQAYALWQQGFRYWFDEKENRATNERNQAFEAPDSEYELVAKYYRRPMDGEASKFLTASDVLERLSATVHGLSAVKIGMALGKLGTPRVRIAGKYGYRLVELTPADIEARQRIPDDYGKQAPSPTAQQSELPF